MTRRWPHRFGLVLLLLVTGLVLVPKVPWSVSGALRGEAFYRGMPVSWWEQEIDRAYVRDIDPRVHFLGHKLPAPSDWYRIVPASLWDRGKQWVQYGQTITPGYADTPPLLYGDPQALPVLLILIRSRSAKVRQAAITGLFAQGNQEPEVVAALREALNDPDNVVRQDAEAGLQQLDFETAANRKLR
jgi:hypothetical protein